MLASRIDVAMIKYQFGDRLAVLIDDITDLAFGNGMDNGEQFVGGHPKCSELRQNLAGPMGRFKGVFVFVTYRYIADSGLARFDGDKLGCLIDDTDADTSIGLGEGMGGRVEIYGVELLRGMCLEQILTEGTSLTQAFGRLFVDDAQFKLDFLRDGHKIDTLVAVAILSFNYTGVHWHWRGFFCKKGADFEDRATNIGVMVSHGVSRV
jgi:hypothetical protein